MAQRPPLERGTGRHRTIHLMLDHWFIWSPFVALGLIAAIATASLLPAVFIKKRMIADLRERARGRLAITYDDGPGPELAGPLLELFQCHGARASFFLVGFRAERFPETADRIAAAGHEMGNHTYWHRHAWMSWPWLAVRDLHQGLDRMSRWMRGDAPFRPPFGKLTTWSYLAARSRHCPLCFWTDDGADTWARLPEPREIAAGIIERQGGVVLLHSHDRGPERQRYVLAITEALLQGARDRGIVVCTMSEFLNAPVGPQRAADTSHQSEHA